MKNKFNIGDLVSKGDTSTELWIVKDFIQRDFYNELGENLYFEYYLENARDKFWNSSVLEFELKLKNHLKLLL